MSEFEPQYVFVYGTLKGMHKSRGRGKCELIDAAKTADKYVLYNGGYPAVRKPEGEDEPNAASAGHVMGELHLVTDEEFFNHLDRYEGHPTFFHREKVKVMTSKSDEQWAGTSEAWMYIGPSDSVRQRLPIIPDADGLVTWG